MPQPIYFGLHNLPAPDQGQARCLKCGFVAFSSIEANYHADVDGHQHFMIGPIPMPPHPNVEPGVEDMR